MLSKARWHGQVVRQKPAKLPSPVRIWVPPFFHILFIFMLTIVSTPIGHLKDLSIRAIEVLRDCDLVLCEDTRHSQRLFNHHGITTPTRSYHKFNEAKESIRVINELKSGSHICLVSDAGTPTISDPGTRLIKECVNHEIPIDSIPGPCAAILALTLSGLDSDQFQFIGFLPKKDVAVKKSLFQILHYPGTTICYESPNRLINILKLIHEADKERSIVVARELTKKFQEVVRGTPMEVIAHFEQSELRGEIVLLIGEHPEFTINAWREKPIQETLEELENTFSLSRMEAVKTLASLREQGKREIYKLSHSEKA